MSYVKNTWTDQAGQVRYSETVDADGYKILTANYEQVTELGTPVNADNMNHIENGIADCFATIDTKINAMLQLIYPIGSIYVSTSAINPLEDLFGTWELVAEGRVLQGADTDHEAGTTIAAGLPNVNGRFRGVEGKSGATGCFYNAVDTNGAAGGQDDYYVYFDASRSSSIYGNSTTVQPPAYVVNIWRRIS